MKNSDIRTLIKQSRLFNYEIAKELKISEYKFSVLLRDELDDDMKKKIISVIDRLTNNK